MSGEDFTTTQVAIRLDTPERTIRLWCKQGRFPNARQMNTPRGSFWLIPATDLDGFEKPERGRPSKPKGGAGSKAGKK
jgi:hypothetical protein